MYQMSAYAMPGIPRLRSMELSNNRKNEIIRSVVCQSYEITNESLVKVTRKRDVVDARHLAIYFMKNLTSATLLEVAQTFGQDHTTAIHAISKVKNLMETDLQFSMVVNNTFATINQKFREYRQRLKENSHN